MPSEGYTFYGRSAVSFRITVLKRRGWFLVRLHAFAAIWKGRILTPRLLFCCTVSRRAASIGTGSDTTRGLVSGSIIGICGRWISHLYRVFVKPPNSNFRAETRISSLADFELLFRRRGCATCPPLPLSGRPAQGEGRGAPALRPGGSGEDLQPPASRHCDNSLIVVSCSRWGVLQTCPSDLRSKILRRACVSAASLYIRCSIFSYGC